MNIFSNCFEIRVAEFAWHFAPVCSAGRFLSKNISQGRATSSKCGGIFYYRFTTNLLLSVGERILKIGQYLAKLEAKL